MRSGAVVSSASGLTTTTVQSSTASTSWGRTTETNNCVTYVRTYVGTIRTNTGGHHGSLPHYTHRHRRTHAIIRVPIAGGRGRPTPIFFFKKIVSFFLSKIHNYTLVGLKPCLHFSLNTVTYDIKIRRPAHANRLWRQDIMYTISGVDVTVVLTCYYPHLVALRHREGYCRTWRL